MSRAVKVQNALITLRLPKWLMRELDERSERLGFDTRSDLVRYILIKEVRGIVPLKNGRVLDDEEE